MNINVWFFLILFLLMGCDSKEYTSDGNLRFIKTGPLGADGVFLDFNPVKVSRNFNIEYDISGLTKARGPYTFYFISNEDHKSIMNCKISYEYYIDGNMVDSASSKIRDMRKSGPYPHPNYYFKAGGQVSIPQKNGNLGLVFKGSCDDTNGELYGFASLRFGGGEK